MHDVAIVGLGVMGAAAAHELARRGLDVVAIEAYDSPHELGSSHGRTRIIREAYFEHPQYVPLVQRAYDLWLELEELTGTVLYRQTGGLVVGPADGVLVQGSLASARTHALEHELLGADEIRHRFRALLPQPHHAGVFEPRAGALLAEHCVRTLSSLAQGYGTVAWSGTRVVSWSSQHDHVVLHTSDSELRARQAIFAAGAWLNELLHAEARTPGEPALQLPLTVERQVPHWFAPPHGTHKFRSSMCPITLLEYDTGRILYTIPDFGHGVKAGIHHEGAVVNADTVDRTISTREEQELAMVLDEWMPGVAERVIAGSVCLYTNTPDGHFIIDRHPAHQNVILLSACSGHGFKFAPAIAEYVADMLEANEPVDQLMPFALSRLGPVG